MSDSLIASILSSSAMVLFSIGSWYLKSMANVVNSTKEQSAKNTNDIKHLSKEMDKVSDKTDQNSLAIATLVVKVDK